MCQDIPDVYVFGYGSLIWRPGFPYSRRFNGFVKGFKRRFWQQSRDHRGTPKQPGRVVTIVPTSEFNTLQPTKEPHDDDDDVVWGTVYCIKSDEAAQCLECLDVRERGGYQRQIVPVYVEGNILACMAVLYVGSVSRSINKEFIGPESIETTAQIIATTSGNSGPNRDYLNNLANSLRNMSLHDPYVFELERLVREISAPADMVCFRTIISTLDYNGVIMIDSGATQAISQRSKGLLPVGIQKVVGDFEEGSVVMVVDQATNEKVSKGMVNYSAKEINVIRGHHSRLIPQILGRTSMHECVISKSFMVLV
ncbi:glutathione-specific gamma-glutamylcyclotransferase [Acrasis kona]|uniref:glutathione-specific gamma-glutamylcyclotransferase n=1 Tax=Acrasis kona TaxID=1008807 RepID=A0AAW2YS44_9EUKA